MPKRLGTADLMGAHFLLVLREAEANLDLGWLMGTERLMAPPRLWLRHLGGHSRVQAPARVSGACCLFLAAPWKLRQY